MPLKPTKQKIFKKKLYGFDIETAKDNKKFVLASIFSHTEKIFFYNPKDFIKEIRSQKKYRDSVICATNLSFDFFGIFFSNRESKHFHTLFRGSSLLYAKTYLTKSGEFTKESYDVNRNRHPSITFIDTLNYASLSVSKMGKILGKPKLEKPDILGYEPQTQKEWETLKEYNLRDSEITHDFMEFMIKTFELLGATFKDTIASTSMSLFKNVFLQDSYFQPSEDVLIEQLKSLYGGRTEAFKRGYFKDKNYYDFNSLYPSVMEKEAYPDPNSLRITTKNTNKYILGYEGISYVEIVVPETENYPLLPFRQENGRVVFPTGKLKGWYTHPEIREALRLGYVLTKVHKTQYFTRTCRPFKDFVNTLYNKRKELKKQGSPMEYVVKITLNSLFGKFSQKFKDRDNWIHESHFTIEKLSKYKHIERKGDYIRIVKDNKPSAFCIPIWSSYTSAYGRIKLHRAIKESDPIYCDTDSLITDKTFPESNELGGLKLEMRVKEGIVVRPKFYAIKGEDDETHVKIKGLGKRLTYLEFIGLLHTPLDEFKRTQKIEYQKFATFKEALRRDMIPNERFITHKQFSLEDNKRHWSYTFNPDELQNSLPKTFIECQSTS